MVYGWYYDTVIGRIIIREENSQITNLDFYKVDDNFELKETYTLKEASKQLNEYFQGKRKDFDLDLSIKGSKFQVNVWNNLKTIKYGHKLTYKELAIKVGNKNASRAVGNANAKNPIPIFIPCHRVIKSDGSIGGYLGSSKEGIRIKEYLIRLEKIQKSPI
ncbi:Methylated-DNA--protein-cysteine methyltransferase%2C constitutive [uncultured Clostridium sp.]|nr:Methylated-DNA--protein-cysteine methyltransferase%2C constitutive [uncultured Clostridium sp.]